MQIDVNNPKFRAKVYDDILSKEEVDVLLNFAKSISDWEPADTEFWHNRSLNVQYIYNNLNKDIAGLMMDIKGRIRNVMWDLFDLQQDVYADVFQIVRWFPGMEQPPHCDDMSDVDMDGMEWYHKRMFGAIVYLNDDYSGGHTFYPQYNYEIKPKSGRLAVHPGDPDHLHGVTQIQGGMRYTLASFWRYENDMDVDNDLYK